jgi:agmatinase
MNEFEYDAGRLNLPFVGHVSFAKAPICTDWNQINADVAVLGVPNDMGLQYRPGARFGPRAIRDASTLFSFGHGGAYDHEDDVTYLTQDQVSIVDVGDADIIHTDMEGSHANTEAAVRKILDSGAMPLILGGDHSITAPCVKAFDNNGPVHIIHFDAHIDFVDVRHGVRYGHGNPIRRASEMDHVTGITQLGIRNVSSSSRKDYQDAREAGCDILSVRDVRRLGKIKVLERIPDNVKYYVTIDIDGFDPSIAPGTGTPSHGGFIYYEVQELLKGLSKKGDVVGLDLVEVSPPYDPAGVTSTLAAQLLMNAIGFIFHERSKKNMDK